MLSLKTVGYIINTHFSKGRAPKTIVDRWNRGYPDHPITLEDVERVLAETTKQRKAGTQPGRVAEAVVEAEKPVLKVVGRKAPAKKKPSKKRGA